MQDIRTPKTSQSRKTILWIVFALPLLALVAASVSVGLQWSQNDLDQRMIESIKLRKTDKAILLLNEGASANAQDTSDTPLTLTTLMSDFWASVHRREPSKEQHPTALMVACEETGYTHSSGKWVVAHSDLSLIRALLSHHANPNTWNEDGMSVLDTRILCGDIAEVELLLQHGAQQDRTPSNTSLFDAILAGHAEIAKLLLQHGADARANIGNGRTVLHVVAASSTNVTPMLDLLLSFGAHINERDNQGWTPLMYAANQVSTENIRILLRRGADASIRNGMGETALDFTKRTAPESSDKRAIVHLLTEAQNAKGSHH